MNVNRSFLRHLAHQSTLTAPSQFVVPTVQAGQPGNQVNDSSALNWRQVSFLGRAFDGLNIQAVFSGMETPAEPGWLDVCSV